jgi:transcription antitermination factor NusB
MKRREQARQIALQALYQLDVRGEGFEPDVVEFLMSSTKDPEVYFFARRLTEGAWAAREASDQLIRQAAEHWRPERMAILDRNVLRLGVYELTQCPDIPPRVAIDQAIELAKYFSAAESGSFVNGVLDHVLRIVRGEEGAQAEGAAPPAQQDRRAPATLATDDTDADE